MFCGIIFNYFYFPKFPFSHFLTSSTKSKTHFPFCHFNIDISVSLSCFHPGCHVYPICLHHLKSRCIVHFPRGMESFFKGERCMNGPTSTGTCWLFLPRCREWHQILSFGALTSSSSFTTKITVCRIMRTCQLAKTGDWEGCSVEAALTSSRGRVGAAVLVCSAASGAVESLLRAGIQA